MENDGEGVSMGKRLAPLIGAVLLLWSAAFMPVKAAEPLDDGLYAVDYELLQGDRDSTSIANDYFEKPALLKVDGDELILQMTLNHSKWVQELQEASGDSFSDVRVVAEDDEADTRVIQLNVSGDLAEPFPLKMHVVIDELEMPYDHSYTVRLAVDESSLKETDQQWVDSIEEGSKIWFFIAVALVVIVAIFVAIRFRRSK
ncbi:NEAT domain-containing protein [Sporosarcina contaminans]|uniref:NEAT domain-containing protein n=1 Tax=Sporosarcina contaminans TaxID=633403 RepID=A0ABW3TXF0_9BACL